jgi:O-antigen/teichoic acid export membrane protein
MSVARGVAATVVGNASWNILQYVVTGIVGFAVSILTTRYLGAQAYGVLTYVIWLTGVIALLADLGLDQALRRYVPGWFARTETRDLALRMTWVAIAIELGVGALLVAGLVACFPWWSRSLTLEHSGLGTVMAIGLVGVLPVAVSRCAGTYLRSIQSTRPVAIVSILSQVTNLMLVSGAVALRLPLVAFVVVGLIAQLLLAVGLLAALRRREPSEAAATGRWPGREITTFSLIAYAHLLLQQVVWSRSETFFLGVYSPAPEIGYYGLAYGIAGLIGGLIGVSQQALFAAQYQMLASDDEGRSDRLASLSVRYLAVAFLPVFLLGWLFVDSGVRLLYGPAYATVARAFPFLLLGAIVANVLNPVATKINLSNRKFAATLGIALGGAVVNIALDLALIPSHHAWGAAIANAVSQLGVVVASMVFVARMAPVRLDLRRLAPVVFVNLVLVGLVGLVLARANVLSLKLIVAVVAGAVYLPWLAAWGAFDEEDRARIRTLESVAPGWLRPMVRLVRGGLGGAAA